ncbi:hypothetical protein V2W45_974404 [Cenococcum geophilum]
MLRAIPCDLPNEEYTSLEIDPHQARVKRLFIVLRGNDRRRNCSILTKIDVEEPQRLSSTFLDEWADLDMGPLVHVAFVNICNTRTGAFTRWQPRRLRQSLDESPFGRSQLRLRSWIDNERYATSAWSHTII